MFHQIGECIGIPFEADNDLVFGRRLPRTRKRLTFGHIEIDGLVFGQGKRHLFIERGELFDGCGKIHGTGTLQGLVVDLVTDQVKNLDVNRGIGTLGKIQNAVIQAERTNLAGFLDTRDVFAGEGEKALRIRFGLHVPFHEFDICTLDRVVCIVVDGSAQCKC